MQVVETIEDQPALAAALHQPEAAQDAQMLRNGGLGNAGDRRQIAGA